MSLFTKLRDWYAMVTYFKLEDQLEFVEFFQDFMDGHVVSPVQALSMVEESYAELHGKDWIAAKVARRLIMANKSGKYTRVVREVFDPKIALGYELIQKVKSEDKPMDVVLTFIKQEKAVNKHARQMMLPPFIWLMMSLIMLGGMSGYVIPEFDLDGVLKETVELQASRYAYWLIFQNPLFLIVLFGSLYVGYKASLQNLRHDGLLGALRRYLDDKWPFSVYRTIWSARIMKILGLLKKNNMQDVQALKFLKMHATPYAKGQIEYLINNYAVGTDKRKFFGKGLLNKIQRVRIGMFLRMNDEAFQKGLIKVADRSVDDMMKRYRRVFTMWRYGLWGLVIFSFMVNLVLTLQIVVELSDRFGL